MSRVIVALALLASASGFNAPSSVKTLFSPRYTAAVPVETVEVEEAAPAAPVVVGAEEAATVPTTEAWLEACKSGVVSYSDFGLKVGTYVAAAQIEQQRPRKTNAEWRAACDAEGVVSWRDYGVRL